LTFGICLQCNIKGNEKRNKHPPEQHPRSGCDSQHTPPPPGRILIMSAKDEDVTMRNRIKKPNVEALRAYHPLARKKGHSADRRCGRTTSP